MKTYVVSTSLKGPHQGACSEYPQHIFLWRNKRNINILLLKKVQSTLVISNSRGLIEILRDIHSSTYQICRIKEKLVRTTTFNKYIYNWTLEVKDILKILWKREIAP